MAKPQNTRRIGQYTIQERNMIVPDGAKVWIVKDTSGEAVYSGTKVEAITWATEHAK